MTTMEGYVNLEPKETRLTVPILNAAGNRVPLELVIDTGFTGFMSLPPALTRALNLARANARRMMLADGQIISLPTYLATVIWHGDPIRIPVLELDTRPVIGMSLLWNSALAMAVRENGHVSVTELTDP